VINAVPRLEEAASRLVKQLALHDDIVGMRRVREATGIPVLADEPRFSPRDGALLAEEDACDIINIKLAKTGELSCARDVGTAVSAYSPLTLSKACWEISVGTAANVQFAAASFGVNYLLEAPMFRPPPRSLRNPSTGHPGDTASPSGQFKAGYNLGMDIFERYRVD